MEIMWNKELASRVRAHLDYLLQAGPDGTEAKSIARAVNALPVYSDMSGSLAIAPDGTILYYNSESGHISEVVMEEWRIIAAVSAAKKFPDLGEMVPERPWGAKSCPFCSGTGGQLEGRAFCGKCHGLGWISD
jgi:hypothetical protein